MNNIPIQQVGSLSGHLRHGNTVSKTKHTGSFQELLNSSLEKQSGITFSSHAAERLKSRNIALGLEDINRLSTAIGKAESKGSRDALVLMDDLAFVVNIKNKIIITAMTGDQMRDKVVTNIDSTILA